MAGTRQAPTKLPTSFRSVNSELSALQWKLAAIVIKTGEMEELCKCKAKLLHLYGKVVRLEPHSSGNANVLRVRGEIETTLREIEKALAASIASQLAASAPDSLQQRSQESAPLGSPQGAAGPVDTPISGPGETPYLSAQESTSNGLDQRSRGQTAAGSETSRRDSLGPPYNSPIAGFNPATLPIMHPNLRQALDHLAGSLPPPQPPAFRSPLSYREAGSQRQAPPPAGNVGQGWTMGKWPLRFGGGPKDLPVDEFIFRAETLARLSALSEAALTLGLHQLLTAAASSWYWIFIRNEPNATWARTRRALMDAFQSNVSDAAIRRTIMDRLQRTGERFMEFLLSIRELEVRLVTRMSEGELLETLRRNMLPHLQDRLLFVPVNSVYELQCRIQQVEDLAQRQAEVQQVRRSIARVHEIAALPAVTPEYGIARSYPHHSSESNQVGQLPPNGVDGRHNPFADASEQMVSAEHRPQIEESTDWICAFGNRDGQNHLTICWNCDDIGHTFMDCTAPRAIFCYGCGAKNVVRPQCPKCSLRALQGNARRSVRPAGIPPQGPSQGGPALPQNENFRRPQ